MPPVAPANLAVLLPKLSFNFQWQLVRIPFRESEEMSAGLDVGYGEICTAASGPKRLVADRL